MAWWPVARTGMKLVSRRRIFRLFLLLGLANFLFFFAMVYFAVELEATLLARGARLPPFVKEFIFTGSGESYRDFIFAQNIVVMLLLAFSGSVLVGSDFRSRAIAFYLSKPLSRIQYLLGKLAAAAGLTAALTLVPALLLFFECALFSDSLDYLRESWRILGAIAGYGLLVSVTMAALLLGVAAAFQRPLPVACVWGAIFVLLPAIAEILRDLGPAGRSWMWGLLDVWTLQRWVSNVLFGLDTATDGERLPWALAVLGGAVLLSLSAFWRKARAVEVVP